MLFHWWYYADEFSLFFLIRFSSLIPRIQRKKEKQNNIWNVPPNLIHNAFLSPWNKKWIYNSLLLCSYYLIALRWHVVCLQVTMCTWRRHRPVTRVSERSCRQASRWTRANRSASRSGTTCLGPTSTHSMCTSSMHMLSFYCTGIVFLNSIHAIFILLILGGKGLEIEDFIHKLGI